MFLSVANIKPQAKLEQVISFLPGRERNVDLPGLSVFHRSAGRLSLLSGVPMGPKLENGAELWLCVGGELGRLLGLEE